MDPVQVDPAGRLASPARQASGSDAARGEQVPGARLLWGHLSLVAVQLCFGLFPIFGKLAMADFAPRVVVVWRIVVGSAVLLAVAFLRHGRAALPRRADLPRLAVCSLLGVAINMVAFLEGLERTTAVEAGLLMPMIPVYTMVLAVAVRQEAFGARRAVGLAVALAGAALLLLRPGQQVAGGHLTGNLLIVGNTLSYALYLVASKPLLRRIPPLALIAWVFALSLWTIPLFYRGPFGGGGAGAPLVPPGAEAASWLSLGYVLVFATLLSYILNTFALSLVSASTTATYILLQPLITAAGGLLILGERLAPGTWQAAAAILAGVWIVVRSPARRPPPATAGG